MKWAKQTQEVKNEVKFISSPFVIKTSQKEVYERDASSKTRQTNLDFNGCLLWKFIRKWKFKVIKNRSLSYFVRFISSKRFFPQKIISKPGRFVMELKASNNDNKTTWFTNFSSFFSKILMNSYFGIWGPQNIERLSTGWKTGSYLNVPWFTICFV